MPTFDEIPDLAPKRELFKLFLNEKDDPQPFHEGLADRSVAQIPFPIRGARVLDLGCGPGFYTRALERAGAMVIPIDLEAENIEASPEPLRRGMLADGMRLPFPDGTFDGIFCSNMIEHAPDLERVIDEIERVLRPGGWGWVAWTNWWSPWGGHNIVPLHYLGPNLGPKAWRRMFGDPPKNVPGEGLFATYVGETLDLVRSRPGLALLDALPRYYPSQRWIIDVPGVRELATWNCLMLLRRTDARAATATGPASPQVDESAAPTGTAASGALAPDTAGRRWRYRGRRVLRRGKYLVGDDPVLLPVLVRLTPEGTSKAIKPETEVVVEGFPRSGNTFAVFALKNAEGRDVPIASHVHHPSQVKAAVNKGLPTLVVIREPIPALASYLIAGPHGTPGRVIAEYIRYHRELLAYRRHFVVASFDRVTSDFGSVITELNERYQTTFGDFDQSEENVQRVFAAIEEYHARVHPTKDPARVVPRPSDDRRQERDVLVAALTAPEHAEGLRIAHGLYDAFVSP